MICCFIKKHRVNQFDCYKNYTSQHFIIVQYLVVFDCTPILYSDVSVLFGIKLSYSKSRFFPMCTQLYYPHDRTEPAGRWVRRCDKTKHNPTNRFGVLCHGVWHNFLFNLKVRHSYAGHAHTRLSNVNKFLYKPDDTTLLITDSPFCAELSGVICYLILTLDAHMLDFFFKFKFILGEHHNSREANRGRATHNKKYTYTIEKLIAILTIL